MSTLQLGSSLGSSTLGSSNPGTTLYSGKIDDGFKKDDFAKQLRWFVLSGGRFKGTDTQIIAKVGTVGYAIDREDFKDSNDPVGDFKKAVGQLYKMLND